MPATLRLLVALLLAGGVASVTTATALACTCVGVSEKEAFAGADVVVVGVVVATHDPSFFLPMGSTADPVRYSVRVEEVLKGEVGTQVELWTARSGASCGLEMIEGQRWRLYAHRDGDLHVGLCGGNELLSSDTRSPDVARAAGSSSAFGWLLLLPGAFGAWVAAVVLAALRIGGRF